MLLLYDLYQEQAGWLGVPVHHCLGNHDIFDLAAAPRDDPHACKALFKQRTGLPQTCYSFDCGGWHFVVLDTVEITIGPAGDRSRRGFVDDAQMTWLAADLQKSGKTMPTVILVHMPILCAITQYTEGTTAPTPDKLIVANGRAVKELIRPYNVRAVLQGHTHVVGDRHPWHPVRPGGVGLRRLVEGLAARRLPRRLHRLHRPCERRLRLALRFLRLGGGQGAASTPLSPEDPRLKPLSFVIVLCLVTCLLMAVHPAHGQEAPQAKAILGYWYMGTMTGEDHNLVLSADGTLSLQNGGCFSQDPKIKSPWRQQGARITFGNALLRRQLGSYLRVVRYKGYVLLVPQRQEAGPVVSSGYSPHYCFWQDSMQAGGLQLPPLAYKAIRAVGRHHARPPRAGAA